MKKRFFPAVIMLLAITVFLTACPYTSSVPVSAPKEKLDKKLFGKWIKESASDTENPEYFVIEKFKAREHGISKSDEDKYKYSIEKYEYSSSDSTYDKTLFVSHTTGIEDKVFINMQKNGEGSYYIYRIDIRGDNFTLFEVTDNIDEKFSNSQDLYNFVKKHKDLSFFYNKDEEKYIREE